MCSEKDACLTDPANRLQAALAAGVPAAYEAAYDRHGAALYRAALRLLADSADAEDAVQDVFVSLVRSRERIARVANLEAYLFVALPRAAARIHRRRQRLPTAALDPAAAVDPHAAGPMSDDGDRVERAIRRLSDEQRDVLALKIDGELTFARIGAVLDISPNTAASRYRYALAALRRILEE